MSNNADNILRIEEMLLDRGMDRMSKYFGMNETTKYGVNYDHMLWNRHDQYYYVDVNNRTVTIWCTSGLDGKLEKASQFDIEVSQDVIEAKLTEAQNYILNKYTDVLDRYKISDLAVPDIYSIPEESINDKSITVLTDAEIRKENSSVNKNDDKEKYGKLNERRTEIYDLVMNKEEKRALSLAMKNYNLVKDNDDAINTVNALLDISYVYRCMGKYSNALSVHKKIDTLLNKLNYEDIKATLLLDWHYHDYALNTYRLGNYQLAEERAERYLDYCMTVYGENDEFTYDAMKFIIPILLLNGKRKKAFLYSRIAYEGCKELLGLYDDKTIDLLSEIAGIYVDIGAFELAIELDSYIYSTYFQKYGADNENTLYSIAHLFIDLSEASLHSDAVAIAYYYLIKTKQFYGENTYEYAVALYQFGVEQLEWGRWGQALGYFGDSMQLLDKLSVKNTELRTSILKYIARTNSEMGNFGKSLRIYKNLYLNATKQYGENDLRSINILEKIGEVYRNKDVKKAKHIYEKVYDLKCRNIGENDERSLITLMNLSTLYSELSEYNKSLKTNKQAYEKLKNLYGEFENSTMMAEDNLVICYRDVDDNESALNLAKNAYEKRLAYFGEDNEHTELAGAMYESLIVEMNTNQTNFN